MQVVEFVNVPKIYRILFFAILKIKISYLKYISFRLISFL